MTATDSIAALRGAVEGAARALRDGEPTEPAPDPGAPAEARARRLQLQRGDAARRRAGRQPARGRRAPARRARSRRRAWRPTWSGSRSPAPASSTSSSPTPGTCGRWATCSPPARTSGPSADRRAGEGPGRVRLRQPDRPDPRRHRPPRRLRRLAGAAARRRPATRSQREYYVNDAGSQIDRFADSIAARMRGEEPPEDGYAGEYVTEIAAALDGRGGRPRRPRDAGSARHRADARGGPGDARALRRPLRQLVLRAQPLRQRRGRDGARRAREARPHLPPRGRALAAHHRLRRRQGPGPDPLQRRADLPDAGHRLPLGQAAARLRAADRRPRRRPPRLRGADARRDRGARRRPRRASRR